VGQSSSVMLGETGQSYDWPLLPTSRASVDVSQIQPYETNVFGGHYATDLAGNWFALTDISRQVSIGMVCPTDIFRALWIWQVYGGWRGLYHLAIEPGWVIQFGSIKRLKPDDSASYYRDSRSNMTWL
jgi:hypothetical protein